MSSLSTSINQVGIVLSESLSAWAHHIVELSKAYDTIILLYEDEMSDKILAAWAEADRLKLNIQKVGQVMDGIEVYSFGMDAFPPHTMIELQLREASQEPGRQNVQRSAYKSILNELILIQARIFSGGSSDYHLQ